MPALDFPLKELQTYTGISPRPADFDNYWDDAITAMQALGTAYTTTPAEFSAPGVICEYLYFTGMGGANICCKYLRPANTPVGAKIPGIVMFHGYSGDSGGWVSKLAYAYAGYAVLAMDVRGQMGMSQDTFASAGTTLRGHIIRGLDGNGEDLFYRNVFLDTAQTARILMAMPFVDATRVAAMGGSQGGALAITCAALEPAVKMTIPTYPFLCDYKRVWEMDLFQHAYDELSYYIKHRDPRQQHMDAMFEKLGYIDIKNLAPRIKGETYMFISLMDAVCPPSTQFAAYNNIAGKKRCEIYPNHGHEGLPEQDELVFEFLKQL